MDYLPAEFWKWRQWDIFRIGAFFTFVGIVLLSGYYETGLTTLLYASSPFMIAGLLLFAYDYASGDQ